MNQQNTGFNQIILNNLSWFAASALLALFVWIIASNVADPIEERRLTQTIPIQVMTDPDMVVIDQQPRTARVTVRAQQSVISLLTTEDITLIADARGKNSGSYTLELDAEFARRVLQSDTQPIQVSVIIDAIRSQQIEISPQIIGEPPTGFQRSDPEFDISQVLVTGPGREVDRVVAAQAIIDLKDQRATYETFVSLIPVDETGHTVAGVTLEPDEVSMEVAITLPENVREIPVVTNINLGTVPQGYELISFTPDLRTVFVSGDIARLPNSLETESISLVGQTNDFEITVPIILPPGRVFILGDQQTVNVSIRIEPRIATRDFTNIPVTVSGLAEGLTHQVVTTHVTLFVTGPEAELEDIREEDLRVVLDLTSLTPGTYDRVPIAYADQVQLDADNISVSPPTISVTIIQNPTPSPTATP